MTKPKWTPIKIRLGDIVCWEHNPRMSNRAQAERLIESEKQWGQPMTFVVSPFENGKVHLYDGHQRYGAWLTVYGENYEVDARQCDRALTEDERIEFVVTMHAGATGQWDWQKLSSFPAPKLIEWGFDNELKKQLDNDANNVKELLNAEQVEPVDAEPQIDRAAELQVKWHTATGQLWKLGDHRLLIGDCTVRENVERLMGGERAGTMFTDPPYNIEMKATSKDRNIQEIENDNMSDSDFSDFVLSFLVIAKEYVNDDVYICCDWRNDHIFKACMKEVGWKPKCEIVWDKETRAQNLNKWAFAHEFILYYGYFGTPTIDTNV